MADEYNFLNELFGALRPTKEEMINKYIKGLITKEQLDKFMEGKQWN